MNLGQGLEQLSQGMEALVGAIIPFQSSPTPLGQHRWVPSLSPSFALPYSTFLASVSSVFLPKLVLQTYPNKQCPAIVYFVALAKWPQAHHKSQIV